MFTFEIHLTTAPLTTDQLLDFTELCQSLGGKAVLIDLPIGQHTQQPMFSVVKSADDFREILPLMGDYADLFAKIGFPIVRHKVEIPADTHALFFKHHHWHERDGYFEWHGKVQFEDNCDLQRLRQIATNLNAHVSKNALKDDKNHRFITLRHQGEYQDFLQRIDDVSHAIINENSQYYSIKLTKSQAEYCIYDDKLDLDDDWSHAVPHPPVLPLYLAKHPKPDDWADGWNYEEYLKDLIAQEAFLRRASIVADKQFMLKGSHVTRHYFDNIHERLPADLDFVCLTPLPDHATAHNVLSAWVEQVTSTVVDDGVQFVKFSEDEFWRRIDYAMNDDFPTVNTDLACYIDGEPHDCWLEVSFNLPVGDAMVSLTYDTPTGKFCYPYTVGLHYQLAWKLHQTLVRPRFKDIYDLTHLVRHATPQVRGEALQELVDECYRDNIGKERILALFDYDINQTFGVGENLFDKILGKQLANQALRFAYHKEYHTLKAFCPKLPKDVVTLWTDFVRVMQEKGFDKTNPDFILPNARPH